MTTAASKLRRGLLVEALSEMPGSKAHDIDAYCHGWLSSIAAAFVEESEVSAEVSGAGTASAGLPG